MHNLLWLSVNCLKIMWRLLWKTSEKHANTLNCQPCFKNVKVKVKCQRLKYQSDRCQTMKKCRIGVLWVKKTSRGSTGSLGSNTTVSNSGYWKQTLQIASPCRTLSVVPNGMTLKWIMHRRADHFTNSLVEWTHRFQIVFTVAECLYREHWSLPFCWVWQSMRKMLGCQLARWRYWDKFLLGINLSRHLPTTLGSVFSETGCSWVLAVYMERC